MRIGMKKDVRTWLGKKGVGTGLGKRGCLERALEEEGG